MNRFGNRAGELGKKWFDDVADHQANRVAVTAPQCASRAVRFVIEGFYRPPNPLERGFGQQLWFVNGTFCRCCRDSGSFGNIVNIGHVTIITTRGFTNVSPIM